jgi:hypothetical protein
MKNSIGASSLSLSLLFASVVLLVANARAQTDITPLENKTPVSITAARCAYTADNACAGESSSGQPSSGGIDDATLAQLPRRGPGPAFGPRGPMGRPVYRQMWQSQPNGRHVLIGAVIGGLLGWAVAAKGNAGARATLGIATVGAGLGAAIGLSVPAFPSRSPYFRRWPDDEDGEASSIKSAKPAVTPPGSPRQTASADTTPPRARPSAEDDSSTTAIAP